MNRRIAQHFPVKWFDTRPRDTRPCGRMFGQGFTWSALHLGRKPGLLDFASFIPQIELELLVVFFPTT